MAKKKQELTVEEKLAAALVRADEQPYEVPGNWVWVKFKVLAEGQHGAAFKSTEYSTTGIPIVRMGNVVNTDTVKLTEKLVFIPVERLNEFKKFIIKDNDIVMTLTDLATKGEFLGTVAIYKSAEIALLNQRLLRINFNPKLMSYKFLFYSLRNIAFRNYITQPIGGSIQKNISADYVFNYNFPLPPLAEQQRIVDRIESLFDQLDQAKALIQEALDSFETRKAAILHQAFTGALTKKWREEHGVGLESWEEKTIGDIADVKGGKRLPKGNNLVNENTGYPYIRAGDLKNGTVQLEKIQYLTPEIYEKIKNYTVATGDVYVTIVGACIGDVGVVPESADGANLTENAAKITNITCESKYLGMLMASNIVQSQIRTRIASATLGKLSLQNIKLLEIKIPCLPEQHEIVRILDDLFEKEQAAKDLCDQIDQIDAIKKTILGKAFRGELGTNMVEEASAVALLREVLTSK